MFVFRFVITVNYSHLHNTESAANDCNNGAIKYIGI